MRVRLDRHRGWHMSVVFPDVRWERQRMAVTNLAETRATLEQLLNERVLVLDGAMGTMVHALKLSEQDFRGQRFASHPTDLRNFIDILSLAQPAAIERIHCQYLAA